MPIYEYRCRQGHTFEVMQSMGDEPVATCGECRAPVERVFRPVAVHFKGSGFYTTDYGRTRSGGSSGAENDGAKPDSKDSKESKEPKETSSKASDASAD